MLSRLVVLEVASGAQMESQSGIQTKNPRVYARWEEGSQRRDVVYIVAHPANNFMGHYLLEPLRARGRSILALNTRYSGNDTQLLMERAIQDLGAGVRFLREEGFKKVVLIGNSGGGSLATFYQQQAEKLTVTQTPDGRPIDLRPDDFPSVDAIALICAHPGRARTLTDMLDPAVIDEADPVRSDPELDMFDSARKAPFDRDWLKHYRASQEARNRRLSHYAVARLRQLAASGGPITDEPLCIHRTMADPRNLDLTLDTNDRKTGSIWGDARAINYGANGVARYSTLRSFLSQWSLDYSKADGPRCLADTTVPVLNMDYTADQIVFPSQIAEWSSAAKGGVSEVRIEGAEHYPQDDATMVGKIADILVEWGG